MAATITTERGSPDWAAIVTVVAGVTAFAVAQGLTYPLISLTLQKRQVPGLLIGFNAATFSVGLAGATLSLRRVTGLMSGDKLVVSALFGCASALTAFSLTDELWVWFAARALLGFCAGLVFILSEAWLHAASPNSIRGRVSGIYGAGMCLGFAAGPLAIPLFGSAHGFAFASTAVYVASVAFLSGLLSRRTRTRPHPAPAGAVLTVFRRSPILLVMVMTFGFADIAAISGMPVYFVQTGHSEAFAALSVSAMAVPTAIAQPFVGALLDKAPRVLVAIGTALIAALSFLVLPLIQSEPAILLVFAVMGSASFALYTCALTILGERYRGGLLVAGTAAFSICYAAGSVLGSATTGVVAEFLPPAWTPVVVGLVLLVAIPLFRADRRPAT